MNLTQCDVCKKEVNHGEYVVAGTGHFHVMEFCLDCGGSILKLLKKYKFKHLSDYEKENKK